MFVQDQNPYAPPCDDSKAAWDNTLFWQLIRLGLYFMLFLAVCDIILFLQYGGYSGSMLSEKSILEIVRDFLFDWHQYPRFVP